MAKHIAIIEYASDYKHAQEKFPAHDTRYVSVSAEASVLLHEKNVPFITDEDVLSADEFKRLGDENFEITKQWIDALENELARLSPALKMHDFKPFSWNFYRIKILLDAIRIKKILVQRLCDAEKPLSIGAPPPAIPSQIRDHHLFFYRDESIYGLIAKKIAERSPIQVSTWGKAPFTRNPPQTIAQRCASLCKRIQRETKLLSAKSTTKEKRSVLLGSLDYETESLRRELSHAFRFYYFKSSGEIISLDNFRKINISKNCIPFPKTDFRGFAAEIPITKDATIDTILSQRINAYAEHYLAYIWDAAQTLACADKTHDFSAYIHPAGASDAISAIPIHYFDTKHTPVFILQHGAYGFAHNRMTEHCEFGHNGYFLAWGTGIKDMYEHRKKGSCEIIPTGSPMIDSILKKCRGQTKRKRVCYIPNSAYRGNVAYYPNGQPCLDSMMVLREIKILKTLEPFASTYTITYKAAPTGAHYYPLFGVNPMLAWVTKHMPKLKRETKPLQDILHAFDLLIIDWPTTTLVQAAATNAQILVFTGNPYYRLTPEANARLQKRAIVCEQEKDFMDTITAVLQKGSPEQSTENTDFLKHYGSFRNDGFSLQRITEAITTRIKTNVNQ